MSMTVVESVREHGVYSKLNEVKAWIENLAEAEAIETPDLERLHRVADLLNGYLDGLDPHLVSLNALNRLVTHMQAFMDAANAHLTQRREGGVGNPDGVQQAADALLEDLSYVASTYPPAAPETTSAFEASLGRLRDRSESSVRDLTNRTNEIEQRLNQTDQSLTSTQAAIDQRLADLDARSSAAEQARQVAQQEEFSKFVTQSRETLESAQTSLRARLDQMTAETGTFLDDAKSQFEILLTTVHSDTDAAVAQADASGKSVIERLTDLQAEAIGLVGAISRIGMTAGYTEFETSEAGQADTWRDRVMTFGQAAAGVLAVGVIAHLIWGDDGVDLALTASIAGLAGVLLGLSRYAAGESNRHRANAVSSRQKALALASIGPYLEKLDEPRQREVLEDFAYLFFIQASESVPRDVIGPPHMHPLIERLRLGRVRRTPEPVVEN